MANDDGDVPAIEVVTKAPRARRRPVDDFARKTYLDVLRATGSRPAAAAAARPHIRGRGSAMNIMENHITANPIFAAAVADVEADVTGKVDQEIFTRAMEGKVVAIKRNAEGAVVEERREYDNTLLLRLRRTVGRRVDPGGYVDEKRIVVSGGVNNTTVVANIDAFLDGLDDNALRQAIASAEKAAKAALPAGQEEEVEDAELVEDDVPARGAGN